jgi:hypothetical protein
MNRLSTDRCTRVRTFLTVASLALAVFLWGLHYKVSKYDLSGPASHRPIPVKLLSQNERPHREGSLLVNRPRKAIGSVLMCIAQGLLWLLFVQECLLRAVPASTKRRVSRIRRVRPSTALTIFFFRPPPILT